MIALQGKGKEVPKRKRRKTAQYMVSDDDWEAEKQDDGENDASNHEGMDTGA